MIAAPVMLYGAAALAFIVANGDYLWLLATLGFWILLSGLGIAVGFHRVYSHKCYEITSPWLDWLLLACGTLACQGSSISWVSLHRGYHHPYSDTWRDPHTPVESKWNALFGWYTTVEPGTYSNRYAMDLVRRKPHAFVHRHYTKVIYTFTLLLFLVSWKLALYGYLLAASISLLQENLVNWLGHEPNNRLAYRNIATKDKSVNVRWFYLVTWGQLLHNNHHGHPERFSFANRKGEWDPCILFKPLLNLGGYRRRGV
jgi:stearoyl-CoA desaturase (delta-9 desaturase)